MTLYRKLVRDKIPEVVLRDGRIVRIRTADTQEFDRFLKQKFLEETEEFFESFEKGGFSRRIILESVD